MQRKVGLAIALLFAVAAVAQAETVVVVGAHLLLPNTPGQTIQIQVTGGDPVQGVNFIAVVGDGGAGGTTPLPGTDVGPGITADILTGTIFALSNTGSSNGNPGQVDFGPMIAVYSTTTNTAVSPTVNASGLLATIVIDTTGFNGGSWGLNLTGTPAGDTDFAGLPINITNGSISIVPEPTSLVLGLFAAAGLGAVAIRRRARKA